MKLLNSAMVTKVFTASMSSVVSSTVGVPNSLGPGELLVHYGTQEQKDHYLPRLAALSLLSLTLLPAHAQPKILPGLWEFSSGDIQVDGQQMPGMDAMLEQMQNLPADQRRMMEEMLAAQGVKLGGKGVQICLSKAQVEADELPFKDDPACTQEITERGDKLWKFRFECPDARGQGETRFISDKEFVSTVDSEYRQGTETGSSRIESHARWIADDCGTLKPAR